MHSILLVIQLFLLSYSLAQQAPLGYHNPSTKPVKDPFDESFHKLAIKSLDDFNVPGFSIAVVDNGITFSRGYGFATIPFIPATPDTLYYTGSTTKSFTAASILKLIEDSTNSSSPLKLTTPISSLINFRIPDEYATAHATLEDALSHRTGMPRHDFSYGGENFTIQDAVQGLRYLPTTREIRQEFQYCNLMFIVLSQIVETLSKSWVGEFMKDNFWKPLGMTHTFMSLQDVDTKAPGMLATGYFWDNSTKEFIPDAYSDPVFLSGAGGIISSVVDYAKYLRAIMNDETILSKQSFGELRKARIIIDTPDHFFTGPSSYSLGWMISVYHGIEIFYHGGSVEGFGSLMAYVPAKNWAIAIMANADVGGAALNQILAFELLDRKLGTPLEERTNIREIWESLLSKRLQALKNVRKLAYPDAPDPKDAKNHSLPLKAYTGMYYNHGYRYINLTLSDPPEYLGVPVYAREGEILHADVVDRTWPHDLDFEHVNGEHFLVRYHFKNNATNFDIETQAMRCEFRIGSNGKVAQLGLGYEVMMGNELIWFDKVG